MSLDKKRKLEDYATELEATRDLKGSSHSATKAPSEQADSSANGYAIANPMNVSMPPARSGRTTGSLTIDNEATLEQWTVVESTKKKKRKRITEDDGRIKYPSLTFAGSLQDPIKLVELQNIILYTLADGVAPKWVAFKHSGRVKKVVCLMVPGLEIGMFNTASSRKPDHIGAPDTGGNLVKKQARSAADEIKDIGFGVGHYLNGSATGEFLGNPRTIDAENLQDALKPIATIFDQVWPVKAPGDMKYAKIHSPIQAILMAPLPRSQEDKRMKGPKPAREPRSFHSVRTPITEYLLTPDDLREADYPIHTALCESPEEMTADLERRESLGQTTANGWVESRVSASTVREIFSASTGSEDLTAECQVLAMDCEMVLTDDDRYSLARISLVDWSGKTILDELVKPSLPIKNYYTEFSGMTKDLLDPVNTTLSEIQARLLDLITATTILLGHSLESDLSALKLTHPFVIDTSLLYPHPRGPPLRSSLKFLTQKYLHREIQQKNDTQKGHDSVEDALAVLDLVKLKCEKGPKYGTSEMSGETIFQRLSRTRDRTSAIVDYGNPERGYGKEATYAIGCTNDEEIVQGISRAVNGDDDGHYIRGGGVDFVWARLRELESFRGWANNNREYNNVDSLHSTNTTTNDPSAQHQQQEDGLSTRLTNLTTRLLSIHALLPPTTLFLVYSGTGDPRDVGRLQALQRQCKRDLNTKKWDDETAARWTDVEEQELRKAVAEARLGMAFMGVK